MCRAAINRRQLAKVPACAPRHIGASWTTTLPRSPPALAPATAALARVNARLPKDDPRCTTLPRPRAPAPKRATRHSGHAFRKLQAQPQSRFVVHHRRNSRSTSRTGAPGTASPGLSNARLFACSGWPAVLRKSALRVHQSERWSAVTEDTPRFASCWRPRLRAGVPALSSTAPMCRAAPHRRQLAKVPACAPRHIGACWSTTRHSRHDRHLRRALPRWRASMPGYRNSHAGAPPASTPPAQKPAPKDQPAASASTPRAHRQPPPARHHPRSHPSPDAPKPPTPIHAMQTP
jgi:hypothetical protein